VNVYLKELLALSSVVFKLNVIFHVARHTFVSTGDPRKWCTIDFKANSSVTGAIKTTQIWRKSGVIKN